MPRPALLAVACAAGLAAAAPAALADVPVAVPVGLLGGPIWTPVPAGGAAAPSGAASRAQPDPCAGAEAGDCVVVGPQAETEPVPPPEPGPDPSVGDVPGEPDTEPDPEAPADAGAQQEAARRPYRPIPPLPPAAADAAAAFGRLLAPGPGGWLRWETPLLRWRPSPGARTYNVQVFRGSRRVLNAWTRAPRLRVPDGALDQGRSYVWVVWPGRGPRARGAYGPPIGRAAFAVTLRPRIVFRARRGGVAGEVRPHVPFGVLRLRSPRGPAGRVPARVRVDARGRFVLHVRRADAERLSARLLVRGPRPPIGLRGGLPAEAAPTP